MEQDAARTLDARLDRQQYDQDQLITIKVPLTGLAYYNNSTSFERSNGQIEISGVPYRYVESRIYNDSLEMRCILNQAAMQVREKSAHHPVIHQSFRSDPYIGIAPIRVAKPAVRPALRGHQVASQLCYLSLPADERPPASAALPPRAA